MKRIKNFKDIYHSASQRFGLLTNTWSSSKVQKLKFFCHIPRGWSLYCFAQDFTNLNPDEYTCQETFNSWSSQIVWSNTTWLSSSYTDCTMIGEVFRASLNSKMWTPVRPWSFSMRVAKLSLKMTRSLTLSVTWQPASVGWARQNFI